jgi:ribosomal protein S6--L-glutamate ligase
MRCRSLFGLDLYGVDLIEFDGRPVIVDVNHFPGYRGVPGAGSALARYILERLDPPRR